LRAIAWICEQNQCLDAPGCSYALGTIRSDQDKNVWRVLVVEDDPDMREFFAASVTRCAALELAASVGTVAEAREWLNQRGNQIDVLLTDLGLPDGSGLELIRLALRLHPQCEALVISMFGDEDNVLSSIEAGALGYIHMDSTPDDIARTILDMRDGASPISPMIARRALSKYRSQLAGPPPAFRVHTTAPEVETARPLLSPREQDVLALIARGFSYSEVARLQAVTVHTIRTHIKNPYAKLSVHSKTEAVFEATRMGLLPLHS
jgi:DNA-binding NarL/FixJ family response regulator